MNNEIASCLNSLCLTLSDNYDAYRKMASQDRRRLEDEDIDLVLFDLNRLIQDALKGWKP